MIDPKAHPVFSASNDHAVGAWEDVLISYFPARLTISSIQAVHRANVALREMHPNGTTTMGIVSAGIPMPTRDTRAFAAKINREATAHLKGECVVISGHPFWVGMARSAWRAIELVARPWHPRAVFDAIEPASLWVLEKAGRSKSEARALQHAATVIIAACEQHDGKSQHV
jgi:hypothetical protein